MAYHCYCGLVITPGWGPSSSSKQLRIILDWPLRSIVNLWEELSHSPKELKTWDMKPCSEEATWSRSRSWMLRNLASLRKWEARIIRKITCKVKLWFSVTEKSSHYGKHTFSNIQSARWNNSSTSRLPQDESGLFGEQETFNYSWD